MSSEARISAERSGIPKTMGILLIIFAALYLFSSLFSAVTAFVGGSFVDMLPVIKGLIPKFEESGINLEKIVSQIQPAYRLQGMQKLATALISAFGLLAGIKLTHYTATGLRLSVWWALAALGYLVIEVTIFILYLQPMLQKFFKTIASEVGPLLGKDQAVLEAVMSLAGNAGLGSVITGAIFMAIFPILMIALMNTNAAKKACGVDKVLVS